MDLEAILMVAGIYLVLLLLVAGLVSLALSSSWSYVRPPETPSSPAAVTSVPRDPESMLGSLDGVLHSMCGEDLSASLWSTMIDYRADKGLAKPYVGWLRAALAPIPRDALHVPWYQPYTPYWFDDREGWRGEQPYAGSIVRIGLVELGFGAALVVSAYQVGDHLDIVVHGTIVDASEWRTLLARGAMFYGVAVDQGGSDNVGRSEMLARLAGSGALLRSDWVLWRIDVEGRGSYLEAGGQRLFISHVYVLLEMPVYHVVGLGGGEEYLYYAEPLYWGIVGYPAMSLAFNLAYPENTDPWSIYVDAGRIAARVVLTGVGYRGPLSGRRATPFLLRSSGEGVCNEQSRAILMFAADALGLWAAYIDAYYGDMDASVPEHAVALLIHPSTAVNQGLLAKGPVETPLDIDGDGINDTGSILVDTAGLPPRDLSRRLIAAYGASPLHYSYMGGGRPAEAVSLIPVNAYVGVEEHARRLPSWLRPPWRLAESHAANMYIEAGGNVSTGNVYGASWIKEWWRRSPPGNPGLLVWGVPEKADAKTLYRIMAREVPARTPVLPPIHVWEKLFLAWLEEAAGVEDVYPPSYITALHNLYARLTPIHGATTPRLSEILPPSLLRWSDHRGTPRHVR